MTTIFAWSDSKTSSMVADTILIYRELVYEFIGMIWSRWTPAMQESIELLGDVSSYRAPRLSNTIIGEQLDGLEVPERFRAVPEFLKSLAAASCQKFFFKNVSFGLYRNCKLNSERKLVVSNLLQELETKTTSFVSLLFQVPIGLNAADESSEFVTLTSRAADICLYDSASRKWQRRKLFGSAKKGVRPQLIEEPFTEVPEELLSWQWPSAKSHAIVRLNFLGSTSAGGAILASPEPIVSPEFVEHASS